MDKIGQFLTTAKREPRVCILIGIYIKYHPINKHDIQVWTLVLEACIYVEDK